MQSIASHQVGQLGAAEFSKSWGRLFHQLLTILDNQDHSTGMKKLMAKIQRIQFYTPPGLSNARD
jgi:hypothetical protein